MTLEQINGLKIPSMGGTELGPFLYYTLMSLKETPGAVVECGSWLGAGTAFLAAGLRDCDSTEMLHCYDRWKATESEAEKAAHQGFPRPLKEGEDILPYFLNHVGEIYPRIMAHKGDTIEATWPGGPIKLYVDDCNKQPTQFARAMATWGPAFIPYKTVIVLMDYWYFLAAKHTEEHVGALRCQHEYVSRRPRQFQVIRDFRPALSAVAFQFLEPW